MDYLVYAYLQLGQDDKARGVVDEMKTVAGVNPNAFPGLYALAASPARYMIERGDWKGAAELQPQPTPLAHVRAITYFARALGQARAGHPYLARADLAKLIELRDKLREAKDAYWSEQVDIQAQIANAWVLFAEGKHDDALKAMSAAADAEDRTEKHPVTPGVPEPARELYGVMLLDRGMPLEALAAFEATIRKEPSRLNAFLGAAKAAAATGDKDKAKAYYQKLGALAESPDAGRPDLAGAREYLAKN
jgi:tetratricopeptide (TPR) repeat protein